MVRIMKAMFHEKVAGGDLDFNVMVAGAEPKLWWVPEPQQQQQQHNIHGVDDDVADDFGHGCVMGSPEACADALRWLRSHEPPESGTIKAASAWKTKSSYFASDKGKGKALAAAGNTAVGAGRGSGSGKAVTVTDAVAIGKAALAIGDAIAASAETSKSQRDASPSPEPGGNSNAVGAEDGREDDGNEAVEAVDPVLAFDPVVAFEEAAKLVGDGGTILLFSDGGHSGTTQEVLRGVMQIAAGRTKQDVALEAAKDLNATLTAEHKEATASAQEQAQLSLAETLLKLPPTISVVSFGKNPDRVRLLHNMAVLGNGGFNQQTSRKLEGAALKSFTQRMAAQPNRAPKGNDDGGTSRTRTWTLGGNRAKHHYSSCHCPRCDPELAARRKATRKPTLPNLGVVAARQGSGFGMGHVSSSVWLETQSLEALKLTIRHVLRPVAIKRRPTTFNIGNTKRNVTSKVFDDVYRTARVFDEEFEHEFDMFIAVPPANQCTYWVDMSQAHLDVYISRLEAVLGVYRARLLTLAQAIDRGHSSDGESAELGDDDHGLENSDWILALKEKYTDVAYMLEEIGVAKGFLRRAERWERDAPSPVSHLDDRYGDLGGDTDFGSKPRLTNNARTMKAAAAASAVAGGGGGVFSGVSTSSVIETLRYVVGRGGSGSRVHGPGGTLRAAQTVYGGSSPALPPDSGVGKTRRAPRSKPTGSGTRSMLLGVGHVNPGHAATHIGAGLTKKQRGGRKSTDARPRIFPFRSNTVDVGERVLVRRWQDGVHVLGHVRSMPNERSYDILFDNSEFQITPRSYLFAFPEPEYPYIKPRDYVLAPAEGVEGHLPAIVIAINYDGRAVVEFHGGFRSAHHRPAMVKLTAGEYKAIKAYYCDGYLRHQLLQEEETVADIFAERRAADTGPENLHSAVYHGSSATVGLGGQVQNTTFATEAEDASGGGGGGDLGAATFEGSGSAVSAAATPLNFEAPSRLDYRLLENMNHLVPEDESAAPLVAKLLSQTDGKQTWQLLKAPEQMTVEEYRGGGGGQGSSSSFSASFASGGAQHAVDTGEAIEITLLIFLSGSEHSTSAHKILAACARGQCRAVIDVEAEFTAEEAEMICAEINVSLRWPVADQLTDKPSHSVLLQGPGAIRRVQQVVERSGLDGGSIAVPTCIASRSAMEALQQASVIFVPGSGPHRAALDPEMVQVAATGAHLPDHPLSQQSALVQSGEDGWFYAGYVRDHIVGPFFAFEDENGKIASAEIRDLLFESRWIFPEHVGDHVLAEHPSYTQAYGPGEVVEVVDMETGGDNNQEGGVGVTVAFFDGSSKLMVSSQCIMITASESQAIATCLKNASMA